VEYNNDQALAVMKKTTSKEIAPGHTMLYKEFFSVDTGEPIQFDVIAKRVKKRFVDLDRLTVSTMFDLFFLHSNWKGFYKREDNFSAYIKDELKISRTHAYGIINSVNLLKEYFDYKQFSIKNTEEFMNAISTSIESIGIKKLIVISAIKEDKKKFALVTKLLDGEEITAEELLKKNVIDEDVFKDILDIGNQVLYKQNVILTFAPNIDIDLINSIKKTIVKFHK